MVPVGIAPRNASLVRHGTLTKMGWDSLAAQSAGLIRASARSANINREHAVVPPFKATNRARAHGLD
jgi:hypothetical protein